MANHAVEEALPVATPLWPEGKAGQKTHEHLLQGELKANARRRQLNQLLMQLDLEPFRNILHHLDIAFLDPDLKES